MTWMTEVVDAGPWPADRVATPHHIMGWEWARADRLGRPGHNPFGKRSHGLDLMSVEYRQFREGCEAYAEASQ